MYNAVMIKNKSLKKVYLGVNDASRSVDHIVTSVGAIRSDLRLYGTNNFTAKIIATYATRKLAQDAVYKMLATKYEEDQVYNDHKAAVKYFNNQANSKEIKINRIVSGSRAPIPVIDAIDNKEYPSMNQASIKTGISLNEIQKSIIDQNGRFKMVNSKSAPEVKKGTGTIQLTEEEAKTIFSALKILKDKMEA